MTTKFVLIGYLRKDLYFFDALTGDEDNFSTAAEDAVKQGRAQSAFVLKAEQWATASEIAWDNPDQHHVSAVSERPSSVPPLNPGAGEQESLDKPADVVLTSLRDERAKNAEESPKGPDTGTNPDGTPSKDNPKAEGDAELEALKKK